MVTVPVHASIVFTSSLAVTLALVGCGDDTQGTGATTTTTETTTSTSSSTSTTTGGGGMGGGGGAGGSGGATTVAVEIPFRAQVGSEVFDCETDYPGLGTTAATASLSDFRLYIHDVRLLDASHAEIPVTLEQDGLWQYQDLALLDFENKKGACANGTTETRTVVRGTVPAGEYMGVAFKVGVPEALNHLDSAQAASPLNLSGLFWSWTDGYKFVRIDAMAQGAADPFLLHLGATGCLGNPSQGDVVTCSNANVPELVFHEFDPATQVVVIDYAAAVADADLSTNGGAAPGCMSETNDPECTAVFPRLGLDLATGDPSPAAQALFRVE